LGDSNELETDGRSLLRRKDYFGNDKTARGSQPILDMRDSFPDMQKSATGFGFA
jgi:lipopolysaccharide assembly outer membrane protein LptD (OstA)